MTLVIQTNITGRLSVWLVHDRRVVASASKTVQWHGSDQALLLVDRVLRRANVKLRQLRSLTVVRGPGSFTAVRIGLIIANTLGHLLDLPLHGTVLDRPLTLPEVVTLSEIKKKSSSRILPWYGKEPNITRPRQVRAKR